MKTYCREEDTACAQQPLTYSYNFITFVSNLPIPPIGHLDLFTMRGECVLLLPLSLLIRNPATNPFELSHRSTLVRNEFSIHP